ncbi:MAG: deoxyribonuclease IV, partial [Bacteroidales bacterium]|nr:deoxyribonuclease IV [Bacteroidales bacterium]
YIINKVEDKTRVGVCIDTCHAYSAGYNLKTDIGYEDVFQKFDAIIGASYLKAIHLNDTKKEFGSHVDRHDSIGKGFLGMPFFKRFMKDSRFDNMPLILETPDETLWQNEIALLRKEE